MRANQIAEGRRDGYCECGCGGATKPLKGHPGLFKRFVYGHHLRPQSPVDYIENEDGCWEWQRNCATGGYGMAYTNGRHGGRKAAHRIYYERFVGPIPDGNLIHHKCENPRCVNPDHLQAVTPKEHRALHRASRKGKSLTTDEVQGIRLRLVAGDTRASISRRFGVTLTTVGCIASGATHKKLPWPSWQQCDCGNVTRRDSDGIYDCDVCGVSF